MKSRILNNRHQYQTLSKPVWVVSRQIIGYCDGHITSYHPGFKILKLLPIDGYYDRVECKASAECSVLAPDGTARIDAIFGSMKAVVHTTDYNKKPCNNCQDFVDPHRSRIMTVSLGERVNCHRAMGLAQLIPG